MKLPFIFTFLIVLIWGCDTNKSKQTNQQNNKIKFDTSGYSLNYIDDLHERLTLKDHDKSLLEYIYSNPNKVDSLHNVVYLLPFGNMNPEVEELLNSEVEYLKAFLQLEVKILERISYDSIKKINSIQTRMVPSSDFQYYSKMKGGAPTLREQIQANSFMKYVLESRKPKDAIAVLGITEHDIYNPKYNFLFGVSELKNRIGLVSTFRLIDYGEETKSNIRKVVSKQIVNMFSISNVKDFKCVMNFHINRDELNRGKFDLSPRALEKLKYAIGFDYMERFIDLAEFWKMEGNVQETQYYEECGRRTQKASH